MNGDKVTYKELYAMAADMLGSKFDAGQLFTHVTQKRVRHLPFIGDKEAAEKQARMLVSMCEQRRSGVPLQYLLGEWEFYGLPFKVGRGVLIPRADTEVLVERALELIENTNEPQVLDLCSGTGCIAIAISHERPDAKVTALEVSEDACKYLYENIELNNSAVRAVREDLQNYRHPSRINLLTCNPPYIPTEAIASLQPELWYEPRRALNGGSDGLDFYHIITRLYKHRMATGGYMCFEVGIGQSEKVADILKDQAFRNVDIRSDYSGIPRVVSGQA